MVRDGPQEYAHTRVFKYLLLRISPESDMFMYIPAKWLSDVQTIFSMHATIARPLCSKGFRASSTVHVEVYGIRKNVLAPPDST